MYFDRFDIAEAHYLWLRDHHRGQSSREYSRLCKLQSWFRPSPFVREHGRAALSENGKAIYDRIASRGA